ncbi:MAG: hypothetical protein Kow0099_13840 [Candidatus Abyssubacteria bacterium]
MPPIKSRALNFLSHFCHNKSGEMRDEIGAEKIWAGRQAEDLTSNR